MQTNYDTERHPSPEEIQRLIRDGERLRAQALGDALRAAACFIQNHADKLLVVAVFTAAAVLVYTFLA